MEYHTQENKHGMLCGYYVEVQGEVSEEEITRAKELVVEEICNQIREIAREREDFFIIKNGARFPGLDEEIVTTVGAKFELPTVKEKT